MNNVYNFFLHALTVAEIILQNEIFFIFIIGVFTVRLSPIEISQLYIITSGYSNIDLVNKKYFWTLLNLIYTVLAIEEWI